MISKGFYIRLARLISRALYYSGAYALLNFIFRRNGVYIVFYHRLGDKTKDGFDGDFSVDCRSFARHVECFKAAYEVISMDAAVEILSSGCKPDKKYLVVTFDDGYSDNRTYGSSIFKSHGIMPVIYLAAGCMENGSLLWNDKVNRAIHRSTEKKAETCINGERRIFRINTDRRRRLLVEYLTGRLKSLKEEDKLLFIKQLQESLPYEEAAEDCRLMLDWEQVKELMEAGAAIGGHTMTHPILSKVSEDCAANEILDSKLLIEKRTGKPAVHFAYPNGKRQDFNAFVKREAAKHYKSAVTTICGVNGKDSDLYELKRIGLSYDMGVPEVRIKLLYAQIRQGLMDFKSYLRHHS